MAYDIAKMRSEISSGLATLLVLSQVKRAEADGNPLNAAALESLISNKLGTGKTLIFRRITALLKDKNLITSDPTRKKGAGLKITKEGSQALEELKKHTTYILGLSSQSFYLEAK